jgi:hypothetical protein
MLTEKPLRPAARVGARLAMEQDRAGSVGLAQDFDGAPADAGAIQAQHFPDCLLRGKSRSEAHLGASRLEEAVTELPLRVETAQKAVAEVRDRRRDRADLYEVEADNDGGQRSLRVHGAVLCTRHAAGDIPQVCTHRA